MKLTTLSVAAAVALGGCGDDGESGSGGGGSGRDCHPSYSKCLDSRATDYDCRGGTGNGPKFVSGPVQVSGSDPFDLDADGNGTGCE
jgi:hypothetical protein